MDADPFVIEGALLIAAALLALLLAAARELLRRRDSYGSAGWGAPGREFVFPNDEPLPPTAFLLSSRGRRRIAAPETLAARHGLVLGGSGVGKSRGYFLPNAALRRDASLVCADPKNELWTLTSGVHREAWRFAPTDPDASRGFNWIPLCADARIAELAARALVESGQTARTEQAWLDLEAAFLAAVFAHASTLPDPTPLAAYRLFTEQPLDALMRALRGSPSSAAREQAVVLAGTSERMRGSYVPVVAARLQFLRDPAVRRFTSAERTAPDFGALRRRPVALYWCLHESDVARLRPLTSLFFTLLLDAATRSTTPVARAEIPLVMLLDEFAQMTVPNFDSVASVARGRGVSLWLGLQSLSQLDDRYGPARARTILANMATKVVLSGLDVDACEWVSRTLGESTRRDSRESRHRRGLGPLVSGTSTAEAEHARRLLTPDEVRRMPEGEAIVVSANRRPMRLKRDTWDGWTRPARTAPLGPALGGEAETGGERAIEEASRAAALEPPPMPPFLSEPFD